MLWKATDRAEIFWNSSIFPNIGCLKRTGVLRRERFCKSRPCTLGRRRPRGPLLSRAGQPRVRGKTASREWSERERERGRDFSFFFWRERERESFVGGSPFACFQAERGSAFRKTLRQARGTRRGNCGPVGRSFPAPGTRVLDSVEIPVGDSSTRVAIPGLDDVLDRRKRAHRGFFKTHFQIIGPELVVTGEIP